MYLKGRPDSFTDGWDEEYQREEPRITLRLLELDLEEWDCLQWGQKTTEGSANQQLVHIHTSRLFPFQPCLFPLGQNPQNDEITLVQKQAWCGQKTCQGL